MGGYYGWQPIAMALQERQQELLFMVYSIQKHAPGTLLPTTG